MVQFAYTILYVADVVASIQFYETAFGFTRKFITPENDYAELSTGTTTISFASHTLANSNLPNGYQASSIMQKPFGIELGFVVENIAQTIENAIKVGAILEAQPVVKPWGQTVAYIKDINGFLIEICSAIEH